MGAYPGIKHSPHRNMQTDVLQYPYNNDVGRKVASHGLSERLTFPCILFPAIFSGVDHIPERVEHPIMIFLKMKMCQPFLSWVHC